MLVHRALALLLMLAVVLGCTTARAAENPMTGTWKVVSRGAEELNWTLTVKEQDGKLSGTLKGDMGEFPLIDPKLDGDSFTFKLSPDETTAISVAGKVSGKSMQGSYKSPTEEGTFTADKQP
jgi:hypothetical protein